MKKKGDKRSKQHKSSQSLESHIEKKQRWANCSDHLFPREHRLRRTAPVVVWAYCCGCESVVGNSVSKKRHWAAVGRVRGPLTSMFLHLFSCAVCSFKYNAHWWFHIPASERFHAYHACTWFHKPASEKFYAYHAYAWIHKLASEGLSSAESESLLADSVVDHVTVTLCARQCASPWYADRHHALRTQGDAQWSILSSAAGGMRQCPVSGWHHFPRLQHWVSRRLIKWPEA